MTIDRAAKLKNADGDPTEVSVGTVNSGFAIVVPAWKLRELLDEEVNVTQREREEDKQRRRRTASLDASQLSIGAYAARIDIGDKVFTVRFAVAR